MEQLAAGGVNGGSIVITPEEPPKTCAFSLYCYLSNSLIRNIYYVVQTIKARLPHIVVTGIPTIDRCVITKLEDDKISAKSFHIELEVLC